MFYLPILKGVVGHHKLCNEVMFWFTQMMCYNVYIPMLIRQANDVEENPGPQYLISLIRQPLCLLTLVREMKHSLVRMLVSNVWQCHCYHNQIHDISLQLWTNSTLNNILVMNWI